MSEDGNDAPLMTSSIVEQPDLTKVALLPGAELALQREARGWTIAEVADQLNLAARQIAALETDNYAALPGMAIVRGFIRAYAKLLKIDPTPLLANMPVNPSASLGEPIQHRRAIPHSHFSDTRLNGSRYGNNASKWYSVVLLLVAIIGGVALAQHFDMLPSDLHALTAKVKSSLGLSGASTAIPSADGQAASAASNIVSSDLPGIDKTVVIADAVTAPSTPANAVSPTAVTATEPANTAVPLALNAATSLAKIPAAGDLSNQLVLNLRDDSWIEIRGTHMTVASKLYRAGATETFDITEPVQLIVGNASGVDATLRGAPLVLQASAKNNVARLNLK